MSYQNIPAGKDLPNDIYVVIEIPANSSPVKYEIDKDADALFVDRFMASPMFYPANYGYINNTLADGQCQGFARMLMMEVTIESVCPSPNPHDSSRWLF